MGHGGDAVEFESAACRVLPVIEEESESEGSPEMMSMTVAERRKAIVSRMRELLRRAAAAQSAHSRLRSSTVATAKKWKRVVRRIKKRGASSATCKDHHPQAMTTLQEEDGMMSWASSSMSSQSSFSWDAAAESCSSAMSPGNYSYSPVLWPAFGTPTDRQLGPSPAASVLRLSCGSARFSLGSDDDERMAHWVTTDSDFVVLEL
ncbi:hypothetical protein ACP70R_029072 [Stipagrostis hirtigluma subsp. patula]